MLSKVSIKMGMMCLDHIDEYIEGRIRSEYYSTYRDDLSKINSKNGSEFIVHYQNQPYVFEQEEEGLLVYKNGNQQIKINPTSNELRLQMSKMSQRR